MEHLLTIEYDDEILFNAGLSQEEFAAEARLLLAAKLFEVGRLTSGQAARLCGMGRVAFLNALPRVGVSMVNLRSEDATDEVAFIEHG